MKRIRQAEREEKEQIDKDEENVREAESGSEYVSSSAPEPDDEDESTVMNSDYSADRAMLSIARGKINTSPLYSSTEEEPEKKKDKRMSLSPSRAPRRTSKPTKHLRPPCPVCPFPRLNVPRHLRTVHDMSRQNSVEMARKNRMKAKATSYPMSGCKERYLVRVDTHLKNIHKLEGEELFEMKIKAKKMKLDAQEENVSHRAQFLEETQRLNREMKEKRDLVKSSRRPVDRYIEHFKTVLMSHDGRSCKTDWSSSGEDLPKGEPRRMLKKVFEEKESQSKKAEPDVE